MEQRDSHAELVTYAARLVRVVTRAADNEAPTALRLLSQLDELGEVTVSDLARADRSSQPAVSDLVRNLVAQGFVRRSPHPSDARSTLIGLTDQGREELTRARGRHGRIVNTLVDAHDVSQAAVVAAVDLLRTLTTPTQPTQPTRQAPQRRLEES